TQREGARLGRKNQRHEVNEETEPWKEPPPLAAGSDVCRSRPDCDLARASETAARGRNRFLNASARSERDYPPGHIDRRPEISELDAVEGNFSGARRRDAAFRRQILRATPRR